MRSEVQVLPGPPPARLIRFYLVGGVAQLGERLLCKQEVIGSIPFTSTTKTKTKTIRSGKDWNTARRRPRAGAPIRYVPILARPAPNDVGERRRPVV